MVLFIANLVHQDFHTYRICSENSRGGKPVINRTARTGFSEVEFYCLFSSLQTVVDIVISDIFPKPHCMHPLDNDFFLHTINA